MQTVPRLIDTFIPEHYDLSLAIDRLGRSFSGTVSINGDSQLDSDSITLHSKGLVIESVTLDGKAATFTHGETDSLLITHPDIAVGRHLVVVTFSGTITDAMHGMYPCYFEDEGTSKELIATQFESHHAREVFPCIDEPAAKASFDVSLTTEQDITVLGNMPVKNQQTTDDRLVTQFETSPRMSTYLLAWVTGEMHKVSARTKSDVEVNVWATPAQSPAALTFALDHAVKTIEFFDDYFGVPYPLPKSDHVALPDFSSGAMENWGLITYREVALLADPKTTTIASKQYIATVISHELSHMWFGNLVTMKWWNNLWLNESFATLMEYVAVDAIHPEWQAWLDFATHESILALRRDAVDGVQAVQVDVNHPDEIGSLFDGAIVYAKGARLMRMLQSYIGDRAFQAGLQSYFKEFAYRNTEADDLWRHFNQSSGKDIQSFMNTWISQSGYPVVHVSSDGLVQEQFFIGPHADSQKRWPIPLFGESDEDMPELLETASLSLPVADDERLNTRDRAHFVTHYQPDHLARLLKQVASGEQSEIDRLQLLHEQSLLIRANILPSSQLIAMLQQYQNESTEHVWGIIGLAFSELKKFVETDEDSEQQLRKFAGILAEKQFNRLGWNAATDESEDDTKLRSSILGMMLYSRAPAILKTAHTLYESNDLADLDSELRSLIISTVVRDSQDIETIRTLLDTYRTSSSADLRDDICAGLTSVKQPEHVELLLAHFTDNKTIRHQDVARWFVYLIRNKYARVATWQWMKDNWDWIEKQFSGDKSYDDFARYSATGLMTAAQLDDYRNFFAPLSEVVALRRTIELGLVEIEARVALIESDSDGVHEALRQV